MGKAKGLIAPRNGAIAKEGAVCSWKKHQHRRQKFNPKDLFSTVGEQGTAQ